MITTQRTQAIRTAIANVRAIEDQLRQQIEAQLENAAVSRQDDATRVLRSVVPVLSRYTVLLDRRLQEFEADQGGLSDAVTSVVGTVAGWIEALRTEEEVSRILRDDYAALSLALIQNRMLVVTALAVEDPETAEVAKRHIDDLRECLRDVESILTVVLEDELEQAGKAFPKLPSASHTE